MKGSATDTIDSISIPWKLYDALMVIVAIVCGALSLNLLLLVLDAKGIFNSLAHKSIFTLTIFLAQEAVFIVPLYFYIIKKYRVTDTILGIKKIPWSTFFYSILKAFGIVFLFNIMLSLLILRFGLTIPGIGPQESHIPLFGGTVFDIIIAIIVLVIIAPVVEELVFRGFLLTTFLAKFQTGIANICAAGIFALVHFEFSSIVIIFFLGLVLNWLFLRTRSLLPCIGFHIINNGLAFYFEWIVWSGKLPLS